MSLRNVWNTIFKALTALGFWSRTCLLPNCPAVCIRPRGDVWDSNIHSNIHHVKSLHWFPIPVRVEYKLSLLTHHCIRGVAPDYLKELLTPQTSSRSLRSPGSYILKPHRTKLCTMGDWAFCSAAPKLWNSLPDYVGAPLTVDVLKCGLKTYLFKKAFIFNFMFLLTMLCM